MTHHTKALGRHLSELGYDPLAPGYYVRPDGSEATVRDGSRVRMCDDNGTWTADLSDLSDLSGLPAAPDAPEPPADDVQDVDPDRLPTWHIVAGSVCYAGAIIMQVGPDTVWRAVAYVGSLPLQGAVWAAATLARALYGGAL